MKQIAVIFLVLFLLISCHGEKTFFMKLTRMLSDTENQDQSSIPKENNFENYKKSTQNIDEREFESNFWKKEAQRKLKSQIEKKFNTNIAKNVILFMGDGMSLSTITASRIYEGQLKHKTGEENSLSFENFDHIGLSKSYCVDKQTADSACSATAYFTGVKNNYTTVGVNAKVQYKDCKASLKKENQLSSFIEWAQKAGKATGIVTNTRVTHASPSAAYAKTSNRDWESDLNIAQSNNTDGCDDIALQLITSEPGKNINVIYGGGRKKFIGNNIIETTSASRGERLDGRDLIDEWLEDKRMRNMKNAHYIHNRDGLNSLNTNDAEYVLGLFANSHLDYHLNRNPQEPTLKEMTISAIEVLKKSKNGFVLFVEGGRIDQAHHNNMAKLALDETVQLSEAVQSAVDMTNEKDTLIIVTSDHSHTMTLAGYSSRGADILGYNTQISDIDKMPYMTLSYTSGPSAAKGGRDHMPNKDEMKQNSYDYPSLVPLSYETHSGEDVVIYGRGPYAHLFDGVLEQNMIPHIIAYAACIADNKSDLTACDNKNSK
ncbi:hypothetical protein PVAND_011010 [Polypedilum vanderplanki]|uniref:alkaline phosphatase n=1 Tax=Polypedilum vanderplanki TaxID=319348 RepID=A0A9J6CHB5_POLVA|nr:hypothetical protein PVAND_011010 [Polypedilum vanderplanki]